MFNYKLYEAIPPAGTCREAVLTIADTREMLLSAGGMAIASMHGRSDECRQHIGEIMDDLFGYVDRAEADSQAFEGALPKGEKPCIAVVNLLERMDQETLELQEEYLDPDSGEVNLAAVFRDERLNAFSAVDLCVGAAFRQAAHRKAPGKIKKILKFF